jgi:tetratricopeptide (TPR) repeat protein
MFFAVGVYLLFSRRNIERNTQNAVRSTLLNAERLIGFGILWFFITISVESSVIPLWMLICEYRVYLPSVGIIMSVVTGVFMLKERLHSPKAGNVILAALVVAIGGLSVATYLRNELWTDKIRLWEDVAEKSPGKARVHFNLGNYYKSLNMTNKAIEQYQIAIKLEPGSPEEHNNLGLVYESRNMSDKAVEQYLIAIKLKPDYTMAHDNLGGVYMTLNQPDKAEEEFMTAIRLQPGLAEAHFNLGLAYYETGKMEKAQLEVGRGLQIMPEDQQARELLKKITERL